MFKMSRLRDYGYLLRLDKPIGILLLLWPTLWALWLASGGVPPLGLLAIFVGGTFLMRSAGCIVNDLSDRHLDGHVARTCQRPLVTGRVGVKEAWSLVVILALAAFGLVSFCNALTILLAILGACWVLCYPLLKRVTYWPQLGLGVAFSWGVPMAFAAVRGGVSLAGWFLFLTCLIWPLIYDTQYAMVDREDDQRVGIKSTAILFGVYDTRVIAGLQGLFLLLLVVNGMLFQLKWPYYASLVLAAMFFSYQQWLMRGRERIGCFHAFLNNHWVGYVIMMGILVQ